MREHSRWLKDGSFKCKNIKVRNFCIINASRTPKIAPKVNWDYPFEFDEWVDGEWPTSTEKQWSKAEWQLEERFGHLVIWSNNATASATSMVSTFWSTAIINALQQCINRIGRERDQFSVSLGRRSHCFSYRAFLGNCMRCMAWINWTDNVNAMFLQVAWFGTMTTNGQTLAPSKRES